MPLGDPTNSAIPGSIPTNPGVRPSIGSTSPPPEPKYAGQDKVNPGSLILSGHMMLEYLGWNEAAELVVKGIAETIKQKRVTYDLERQMEGATKLKCSEYAAAICENM